MPSCPTRVRQIWFSVPKTLVQKYGFLLPNGQPFDPTFYEDDPSVLGAGWAKFFVPPSMYERNVQDIQGGNFIRTSGGIFGSVATGIIGLKATLVYHQSEHFNLIRELYSISNASAYRTKVPIIIRDYVMPEWEDDLQGYTKRVGDILPPIEHPGGYYSGRKPGSTISVAGFTVTFVEADRRQL